MRQRTVVRIRVGENLVTEGNGLESLEQRESQKIYCRNWEQMTDD